MGLRLQIGGAAAVAALAGLTWGGFYAARWREARRDATILPAFRDPGPGPRAPSSAAFGMTIGRSSLDEVKAVAGRLGLTCPDTGMRTMLRQQRAAKKAELEQRKRDGLSVDGVSGASLVNRVSPMERNPQVRLRCDEVKAPVLPGRQRPPSVGRLLLVFDSPELPLRHASFQQTFLDPNDAVAELDAAAAAHTTTFGPPTKRPKVQGVPWMAPIEYEWAFADLLVKVSALNFGARGVSVTETIEVPLPVRPDAPSVATVARAR
jgi:hypothetical protein